MNHLDDYEEGVVYVSVRKHWWQFWLPVSVVAGRYTTIGKVTLLYAFRSEWRGELNRASQEQGK